MSINEYLLMTQTVNIGYVAMCLYYGTLVIIADTVV